MLVLQIVGLLVSGVFSIQNINEIFRQLAEYGSEEMRRMKASEEVEKKLEEQRTEILRTDFLSGVKLEGLN